MRRAARLLILLALLFLSLLGCGQIALWVNAPTVYADTRSRMNADYGPWPFTVIHPVDPAIIEEIRRDAGIVGSGPLVIAEEAFWPTPAPGIALSVPDTATPPRAATATAIAFITPTETPPPPAAVAGPAISPTSTAMALSTPTSTPFMILAATRTHTPAPANTATPTNTPALAPTSTQFSAPAPSSTLALPPTETDTPPPMSTATPSATPTATPTATETGSPTAGATATPTATPTVTDTPTNTPTPSNTPAPTSTATPTDTPTPSPGPCGGSIPSGEPEVIPLAPSPDGELAAVACGTVIIIDLQSNPIVISGSMDPDYDLVYYERGVGGGIMLDWVMIDVCTDASCATAYTVFYWGNGVADANTSIGALGYGPPEADNQPIPSADLWGSAPYQTGIAIDVDLAAPAGAYQWIRIYAPPGGSNDPSEVDAVEVLP
jgi:hypothetical protein